MRNSDLHKNHPMTAPLMPQSIPEIEDELEKILLAGISTYDGGNDKLFFTMNITKEALSHLIAKREVEARKAECKLLNSRFSIVRDDPKNQEMIDGYMLARAEFSRVKEERLKDLDKQYQQRLKG